MAKVKLFRYEISNASTVCFDDDKIEDEINEFLSDKELIEIKVNQADVRFHNNGRSNTIHLIYTIVYK